MVVLKGVMYMDLTTILQVISNVGFPIGACIYLAYSNEKLRETIGENTKIINELKTMISIYFKAVSADEDVDR